MNVVFYFFLIIIKDKVMNILLFEDEKLVVY